ncbi:MAG: peptidoglycan DD-metalloendopeptidase family protein [Lachnospiraceae bacterium]|nr:peptidoglycan DD-metalloendopeptidase family protein [Lachnospiraceae bacterium]
MKKFRKTVGIVVVIALAVGALPQASYATNYSSITSDSIKEKQKQIQDSQNLKKQIQNQISDAKALKKELEQYKKDTAAYVEKVDGQLTEVLDHIDELNNLIVAKENDITVATQELNEAIETEENQYQAMKDRIKFMYEQGETFYLDIMFNAKTFGDFITKAGYIDRLEEYDRKKLEEYKATREWTEICKATLEAEKASLDEAKAAAEAEEDTLSLLLKEKETELANYSTKIQNTENAISNYEAEYAAEVATIEALEAKILEEKKAIAATMNRIVYDGGQFVWPAPQYTRITEEFGWRTHPITGRAEFHSGLDMGAPGGSPILAAYDGVVVASAYNWSMGNYIMIDHGDGLYTVYMHASKLYVSSGDVVVAGETIAAVGTTGSSTGNHLHFSVRLNGQYVNPWPYLT